LLRTPYDILDTAILYRHMKDDIRGKYSRFYYVLCEYIGIKYISHFMCAHRDVTRPNQLGASDRASLGAAVNTASTLVSERLDTEFSVSQSAHDANVGAGTEVRLEFENDTDQIILIPKMTSDSTQISSINWIAMQTALTLICSISTI
jgi:hypothetical protein